MVVKKINISIESLINEKLKDLMDGAQGATIVASSDQPNEPYWNKVPPYNIHPSHPIENYMTIMESKAHMEIDQKSISPGNHTVVVVHGSQKSSGEFKERAARFVSSLNLADTIKAMVVTVSDGKFHAGLTFEGEEAGGVDEAVIVEVGKRFKQIIEVKDAKA